MWSHFNAVQSEGPEAVFPGSYRRCCLNQRLVSLIEPVSTLLLYVSLLFESKDEFIRAFCVTVNVKGLMGSLSNLNPVCVIGPIRLIVLKR